MRTAVRLERMADEVATIRESIRASMVHSVDHVGIENRLKEARAALRDAVEFIRQQHGGCRDCGGRGQVIVGQIGNRRVVTCHCRLA